MKRRTLPKLIAAAAVLFSPLSHAEEAADTVILGGKFYTVNSDSPWAEAVAIKGNDLVYVGNEEGVKAFIGKDTTVGDVGGKLVLPGLVSGHEHPLVIAAFAGALQIEYSEDKDKMLAAVADYVKNKPDASKMSWGGSYEGRVDIDRRDVDKICPDVPFVMIAASGHGAWINSKALEAVGITKGSKNPVDGFERGLDGEPTGYCSTSAAAMYCVIQLDLIKVEAVVRDLPSTIAYFNSFGITATNDAGTPPGAEPVVFSAVAELEKQNKLNLRISGSVIAQRPFHLKRAFEILDSEVPKYQSEMFWVKTFKMHGGSLDGYSAPLLEPYSDRPDYSGPVIFPYEDRLEWTMKAAKMGVNIHTHVIGDRAIREALDSFQAVREAGLNEVRLSTGHSSLVHPDDAPRYKKLNVTMNMYATKNSIVDPTNVLRIGNERLKYWHANRDHINLGTRLAMSADSPTAPLDPWLQMEVAILRKEPDHKEAFHPEQGLTAEEVVQAYTMGAAYQIGAEERIGSLEVGKRADLVILNQDIFEVKPEEIHKTKALVTLLNGEIVHQEAIDWQPAYKMIELDSMGIWGDAEKQKSEKK